ncbi:hypothetical protein B0T20DRAFT_425805 [Sordaria brevicollis]|uniref:Uncharacterized protein n=1 Tax=Sordaria brevicollis TaxID=83679 RepID=A0AAE0U2V0_SORBR|nr:hypothetical protein B0T20DRAFT_425805 [Sordaria brevicollis]
MLQILQRDIWNSLEVKKRKEHLRGAPLPATKAFKEVRQETAGSGGEDSEADSEESDDEPVVTITESPKATPAVRVSPAQKTPSRKRKAADDADLDLDAPAEEASKRATKKPAAEKPPANKPRMARPTTVAAKLNPSLLLSPPTTSEARSSVSPDQTIRQFDATKLLDGPSAASTALATAIAEENPEPAIPPALPAPRKRGRPRKNAAVTAAGVGTTGVDTKAPAPKKHGQPPKNPVP